MPRKPRKPAAETFSSKDINALGRGLAKGQGVEGLIDQIIDLAVSQTSGKVREQLTAKVEKVKTARNPLTARFVLLAKIIAAAGREIDAAAAKQKAAEKKSGRSEYGKAISAGNETLKRLAAGLMTIVGNENPAYAEGEDARGKETLNEIHAVEKLKVPTGGKPKERLSLRGRLSTLLGASLMQHATGQADLLPEDAKCADREAVLLAPILHTRATINKRFATSCPDTHKVSDIAIKIARRGALENLEASYAAVALSGKNLDEQVSNAIEAYREIGRMNGKMRKGSATIRRPKTGRDGKVVKSRGKTVYENAKPQIDIDPMITNIANALLAKHKTSAKVEKYFEKALVSPQRGDAENKLAPKDFQTAVLKACAKIEAKAKK